MSRHTEFSADHTMISTPGISTFHFDPGRCLLKQERQYLLGANVLDIVLMKDKGMMLVSLDNVHSPLSMKRPNTQLLPPIVRVFDLRIIQCAGDLQYKWFAYDHPSEGEEGVPSEEFEDIASNLERTLQSEEIRHEIQVEETVKAKALYSPLGEFLYGLENLRKKPQGDGKVQQGDGLADIHPEER